MTLGVARSYGTGPTLEIVETFADTLRGGMKYQVIWFQYIDFDTDPVRHEKLLVSQIGIKIRMARGGEPLQFCKKPKMVFQLSARSCIDVPQKLVRCSIYKKPTSWIMDPRANSTCAQQGGSIHSTKAGLDGETVSRSSKTVSSKTDAHGNWIDRQSQIRSLKPFKVEQRLERDQYSAIDVKRRPVSDHSV